MSARRRQPCQIVSVPSVSQASSTLATDLYANYRHKVRLQTLTITVTETPRLANSAERKVWQALVEQLEPNDLLVPGQRVTDHLKDHEVDFVVAIEGAGFTFDNPNAEHSCSCGKSFG